MKKYIVIALLFISAGLSAQIPGYQGLRFIVKYNLGMMHPAVVSRPGKVPMFYNNASIEYVVNRAWCVGVKYGFMTHTSPPKKIWFDSYSSAANRLDYKGNYTQHTAHFYGKYFFKRRGFIAPVGPYVAFGAYYQYAKNRFYTSSGGSASAIVMENTVTSHYAGIYFGMGRTFVVANRLLIDLGYDFNFTVPSPSIMNGSGGKYEIAFNELFLRNFVQLHIGLGVLAF